MNKRGLSDRDQNTFIVELEDEIKDIFTEPIEDKIYSTRKPWMIVHLQRNIYETGYMITYKGRAFVQASVDGFRRPVHFKYHKRLY